MKRFLKRAGIFAGAFALCNGLLLTHVFFREKAAYYGGMMLSEGQSVLVCGDSQTELGLNPAFFPELLNYSFGGQPFAYTRAKCEDALAVNRGRIRIVLVDIRFNKEDSFTHPEFDGRGPVPFDRHELLIPAFRGKIVHPEEMLTAIVRCVRNPETSYGQSWQRNETLLITRPDAQEKRLREYLREKVRDSFWKDFSAPRHLRGFSELISAIREGGAEPVLISTPLHQELRAGFPYWDVFRPAVSNLAETSRCAWLDYSDMAFPDEQWRDHNHLNRFGAEVFTKRVRGDLKRLGLLEKAPRAGTHPGGAAAPAAGSSSIHDVRHPTSDVGGARSDFRRPT